MKTTTTLILRLLGGLAVYGAVAAHGFAQDCDKLLLPDWTSTQMDLTTSLSYLSIVNKDNFEEHKKSAGGSGSAYFGMFSGSANYDSFDRKRNELYKQYGLTENKRDLSAYYSSRVPFDRAKLYAEHCLHRHGFLAHVEQADEKEILVRVLWERGANDPDDIPFAFSYLKGGKTISADVPTKLKHAEPKDIMFEREPGTDFRFVVNVPGADPQSVFVPRFIQKPPDIDKPIAEQIRDGADFTVVIDHLKKHIGSIHNDFVMHGFYRQNGNEWVVWSAQHPTRPNHRFTYGWPGDGVEIAKQRGGPINPMDHKASLWGATFTFDDSGKIYHASQSGSAVGEIKIATLQVQ